MTSLPSRAVASLASSTVLRSGGTSAISWLAASIRNFGFEVRAGGPRRSQASSLRIRFCRLASAAAAMPVPLDALQHIRRVAAFERFDDPVVHLPCRGGDFVEEPAVVGHHQQAAGVARPALLQMAGQPGDAFDVEVVGGLVEGDHVPFAHQQLWPAAPVAVGRR